MPSHRAAPLLEFLGTQRESMVTLLEQLVTAESPSTSKEAQREVQDILTAELESVDLDVRRISGRQTGGQLLAVPRTRRRFSPLQLMIGHCDTVWPLGTLASMPLERHDAQLAGPGVFDMKGGLVMVLYALRALREVDLPIEATPIVFINSDEEIGSPESTCHIARLASKACRVWILEPAMGRRGRLKTERKGVGDFTIFVHGRSAHAGLEPTRGVSAIVEVANVVQQLSALNRSAPGVTLNIGTISGGSRTNVVAAEASLTADLRFRTREQGESLEAAIRALEPHTRGARLEVEGGIGKLPLERTARNRRLWHQAKEIGRELDLDLRQASVGGASDGNTASLYAATLDGLGPVGGGAHARHEFVLIDSLVERTALLTLLLASPVEPSGAGSKTALA